VTQPYTPPTRFRAENNAEFCYQPSESGDLQVSILGTSGILLGGFPLTVDHVAWMYRDSQAAARAFIEANRKPGDPVDTAKPVQPDYGDALTRAAQDIHAEAEMIRQVEEYEQRERGTDTVEYAHAKGHRCGLLEAYAMVRRAYDRAQETDAPKQ
jgi:hypothetical protein